MIFWLACPPSLFSPALEPRWSHKLETISACRWVGVGLPQNFWKVPGLLRVSPNSPRSSPPCRSAECTFILRFSLPRVLPWNLAVKFCGEILRVLHFPGSGYPNRIISGGFHAKKGVKSEKFQISLCAGGRRWRTPPEVPLRLPPPWNFSHRGFLRAIQRFPRSSPDLPAKWPNRYSCTVALHSVALRFPRFRGVSQENRATPPQKGPVAPRFSALEGLQVASWKVSR